MDREMSRPAETPVAVLQAQLAAAIPSPHTRGPGRSGGGALGCSHGLLRLGVLGTPVGVPSRQLPNRGGRGCGGSLKNTQRGAKT